MPTWRAQHRFDGSGKESNTEGRLPDERTLNGKVQDRNTSAGTRFAHFGWEDAGYS